MNIPALYGILFVSICGCTVVCNLYTTGGNYRAPINRIFSALGLCVICWSFGNAVTLTAATRAISMIGRRISPFGWGLMYGFFLHYVLLLTGKGNLLPGKWLYPALYLPGTGAVAAFSALPLFGLNEDRLVRTSQGWANAAPIDGWDIFFFCYAVLFTACAAALLDRWGKTGTEAVRRQSRILLLAIALATVLGICSDSLPRLLHRSMPRISAVFTFLPIFAIGYCVERYGLMSAGTGNDGLILNDEKRNDLYRCISFCCILGGILTTLAEKFFVAAAEQCNAVLFSFLLILCGAFIFFVSRIHLEDALKEALTAVVFTVLIPAATWWLTDAVNGTLWVFIFPFIILCLLFNRKILLTTVIFLSVLTQLLMAAMRPGTAGETGWRTYLLRVALICLAGYFSYDVNRIYTQRLRENSSYMGSRTLVAKISRSFVSVTEENFDALFHDMLRLCYRHIRCDKSFGILMDPSGESVDYGRAWPSEQMFASSEEFRHSFAKIRTVIIQQLRGKRMYVLIDAEKLTEKEQALKNDLSSKNIKSAVCVAIRQQKNIIGFLGFGAARPVRQWNLRALSSLEIIANTVADAVTKVRAEREMRFIAYHDQLTGLPNRLLFRNTLTDALTAAKKSGATVGVVFLDLDSFKEVNDTLGHNMGDQLLVKVTEKITGSLGDGNMVSRFGGDEFVLLLNGLAGPDDAPPALRRLIDLIHSPVELNGQKFFVTSSAGAALFPWDSEDADSLIRYADMAMYAAKKLGKDQFLLCSPKIKEKELEQSRLTNLLYHAQERHQLLLYYQPQVSVSTDAIVGMEALLRWNLPEQNGFVSPSVFIPLAERTGLIHPIGEWVLRTACAQCQKWREMGLPEIRIAVNVSLLQLLNPNFCKIVADALQQTGLPAGLLELEITESAANSYINNTDEILDRLKAIGVKLSIDDFGTEYASLRHLKHLPVDSLKMDIQFVHGIEGNAQDQAITKVIINLAKSLNLRITAEGVETKPELDFLSQRMCDEVQGFYYYKPMPAEETEKVLRSRLGRHAQPDV